jgi:hypothetical protein
LGWRAISQEFQEIRSNKEYEKAAPDLLISWVLGPITQEGCG